jgi:DNA-binding MarR family transcriptional regulator
MTELSHSLGITQRRITDLVDALTADALVRRHAHPTDGRSTVVSLTDEGALLQKTWNEHQAAVGQVFEDLTIQQQLQLIEITPILTAAMRRHASTRLRTNPQARKELHT